MTEAKFTSKFNRWLEYKWPARSSASFELKLTKTGSIPFKVVKDHQISSLIASSKGMNYKIPDDTFAQKPFDCFHLYGEGYVVVMFWKRGVNRFYIIKVEDWITESENSPRKSLTEDRANEIGRVGILQ